MQVTPAVKAIYGDYESGNLGSKANSVRTLMQGKLVFDVDQGSEHSPMLDKTRETAVDACAFAAHIAALLGASSIRTKLRSNVVSLKVAKRGLPMRRPE